jgi:hypothetical protein
MHLLRKVSVVSLLRKGGIKGEFLRYNKQTLYYEKVAKMDSRFRLNLVSFLSLSGWTRQSKRFYT